MASLKEQPTRIYNDGPNHPRTPFAAQAEKAYRDWFAKTAADVPAWNEPARATFDVFMHARGVAQRRAVVGADHGVCLFRPGHEIEASKTRGRAQAVWIAIEGWEHFAAAGFDVETIRSVAMQGWNHRVERWSKSLLRPDQINLPPLPHEDIDAETQATLDAIKDSWKLTYDSLPRTVRNVARVRVFPNTRDRGENASRRIVSPDL